MNAATEIMSPEFKAVLADAEGLKGAIRALLQDKELSKKLKDDPSMKELRKTLSGPINPGIRTESREAGHAEAMEIAKELGLDTHSHIGHIKQLSSSLKGGNQVISVLVEVKGQVSKSGGFRMNVPAASFGGETDPKFLAEVDRVKRQQLKMALAGLAASDIAPAGLEEKKEEKTDEQ
jgi:hypothetical protein